MNRINSDKVSFKMIGNDIVDLQQSRRESNWRRKGYLDKIYTDYERDIIRHSPTPDVWVWAFWAIKEAVYKIYFRQHPVWEYAPSKIACRKLVIHRRTISASVSYHNKNYFAKSLIIDDSIIHALASVTKIKLDQVAHYEFENNGQDYTSFLRTKGVLTLEETIEKNPYGVPNIRDRKNNSQRPMSISHHGKMLGVAFFKTCKVG